MNMKSWQGIFLHDVWGTAVLACQTKEAQWYLLNIKTMLLRPSRRYRVILFKITALAVTTRHSFCTVNTSERQLDCRGGLHASDVASLCFNQPDVASTRPSGQAPNNSRCRTFEGLQKVGCGETMMSAAVSRKWWRSPGSSRTQSARSCAECRSGGEARLVRTQEGAEGGAGASEQPKSRRQVRGMAARYGPVSPTD